MALGNLPWEAHLLSLAQEALDSHVQPELLPVNDQALLNQAYTYCDLITQNHSKTFYTASGLLPTPKRRAARALYGFCRTTDDIVDCSAGDGDVLLNSWRDQVLGGGAVTQELVALAWNNARYEFNIPWRYSEQLIQGVAQDLEKKRYQSFAELTTYCYGVACTVGLMAMHIIGYSGQEAFPYAIRLGVALQLTNILRDVGDDWRVGRIYLPQDELDAFGISEQDIADGIVTDRWRELMRFQINRNRQLYDESLSGVALLDKDGRFAIRAAGELYRAILTNIEANDYDVFHRRASISKFGKIRRLPGIWWRVARMQEKVA
ncbi:MAG: squalene/phytoene synthase family protein [Anaerolineales bacterium]|jgi:phytoene synthase|nr:squalene/phytoene synthase family protein [Anaerolineales bacterium]